MSDLISLKIAELSKNWSLWRYAHRARYVDPTDEELRKYPHRAKYYKKREEYIAKEDEYNTNRCFPDRQEHFDENDNFDDVEDSQLIGFYNQGSNRKDFLGLTWRHYFSFETAVGKPVRDKYPISCQV